MWLWRRPRPWAPKVISVTYNPVEIGMGYSEWLMRIVENNALKGVAPMPARPRCPKCGVEMFYTCEGACGYKCPRCGARLYNVAVISEGK